MKNFEKEGYETPYEPSEQNRCPEGHKRNKVCNYTDCIECWEQEVEK